MDFINTTDNECPICLETYNTKTIIKDGPYIRKLKTCKHTACSKCFTLLHNESKHRCPICRLKLCDFFILFYASPIVTELTTTYCSVCKDIEYMEESESEPELDKYEEEIDLVVIDSNEDTDSDSD
jgi:hypothetical protein